MHEQQEDVFHSDFSNEYGYNECDVATELFNTSCCIMDTSFETAATTAMTIGDCTSSSFDLVHTSSDDDNNDNALKQMEEEFQPLFGGSSTTETTGSTKKSSSDAVVSSTFHFESTHEVYNPSDDDDDDDNNNTNTNNFEQLEEEFQIMTSQLQKNIAKLSVAVAAADSISTPNPTALVSNSNDENEETNSIIGSNDTDDDDTTSSEASKTTTTTTTQTKALVTTNDDNNDNDDEDDDDGNKKALLLLDDTIDAVVEIEKQLTQCQDILQQLWNECNKGGKKKKGVSSTSKSKSNNKHEFMDQVHQYSLYKIQWEILRSEYQNSIKNQTNKKPLTHIIDLEMMRKKNELIRRRSAGQQHRPNPVTKKKRR